MPKSFAILGLGRFGRGVALTLYESGADVMVVDRDDELLRQFSSHATYAVPADLSEEDEVKKLGLGSMDAVIVAMGMDIATSILCVMIAKEAGVPLVIAKARNKRMGEILTRIGADKIIYPESESGIRVARSLTSKYYIDNFDISQNVCILEMRVKDGWIGKTLNELDLRKKYHVNVIAIKSAGSSEFNHLFDISRPLSEGDNLLLIIDKDQMDRLI